MMVKMIFFLAFLATVSARMYNFNERIDFLASIAPIDELERCKNSSLNGIEDEYFELPLDHEDSKSPKWENHYQVQKKFYDEKEETVFLLVGGEGTSSPLFVCLEDVTIMTLAKKHKALVIQSEHRFFGPNKGIDDLSNENLKYLTTEQALKDLAALVGHVNKEYKFKNPKWVVFGGSYPGTMTALFRVLYPKLTLGGVASSAPLYPKVDLYEYAQVMEYAFNDTNPDGCLDEIAKAYEVLERSGRTNAGVKLLIKVFDLTKDYDPSLNDIYTLNLAVFDAFQGIVQYTYDGMNPVREKGGKRTVKAVCDIFAKNGAKTDEEHLNRLFEVYKIANTKEGKLKPVDHIYEDYIARFANDSYNGPERDYRGWMWLSCNEFGWLQTTTGSKTFGNTVPIHYYYQQCKDMFDLDINVVDSQIKQTLAWYNYPDQYNGTNVVLPNGLYDPWSVIGSYVNNPKIHTTSVTTEGAAHCHDMYPPYEGEPEGLKATREHIAKEVTAFILKANSGYMTMVSGFTVIVLLALTKMF